MSDKPVLFSAPMVRALIEGRKTQERRVLKPQPVWSDGGVIFDGGGGQEDHVEPHWLVEPRSRYAISDVLFPAMAIPSLDRRYCADIFGTIWSRARDGSTWARLIPGQTSKGYLSVTPSYDGKYRTRNIHSLVAETYYGKPQAGMDQIRHLNGDQSENAPDNLDWGTQEQNWTDRLAHGKHMGESHHAGKLTAEAVAEIRLSACSQRVLSKKFGVTQSTIWAVINNKIWRADIPNPAPPNFPRWTSRITLTVTDVRVQRLQEISEADARAEGVLYVSGHGEITLDELRDDPGFSNFLSSRMGYEAIWNSLHGADAWSLNPWVAALTFTVERRNIDQLSA